MGHNVHYESTREKLKMLLLVKQFKNALEDIVMKSEHSNICKRIFCLASFVNAAKAHYDHKLSGTCAKFKLNNLLVSSAFSFANIGLMNSLHYSAVKSWNGLIVHLLPLQDR